MLELDSLIIDTAYKCKLPAGGALAVDREEFSRIISEKIKNNPLIEVIEEEISSIPEHLSYPLIIASGPLTSKSLSQNIEEFIDRSLVNLGVECIDLLQLHCPPSEICNKKEK